MISISSDALRANTKRGRLDDMTGGGLTGSVNSELDLIEFNLETMVTEWSVRTRIITASSSLFEKTENLNELQTLLHR